MAGSARQGHIRFDGEIFRQRPEEGDGEILALRSLLAANGYRATGTRTKSRANAVRRIIAFNGRDDTTADSDISAFRLIITTSDAGATTVAIGCEGTSADDDISTFRLIKATSNAGCLISAISRDNTSADGNISAFRLIIATSDAGTTINAICVDSPPLDSYIPARTFSRTSYAGGLTSTRGGQRTRAVDGQGRACRAGPKGRIGSVVGIVSFQRIVGAVGEDDGRIAFALDGEAGVDDVYAAEGNLDAGGQGQFIGGCSCEG